ncbi:sex comb on midleg-like protein 4 isoform X2 [Chelonia mydas]|uniref:sex comb on midleg-like protein 4 isoform X2 n=1 Tax=Chelonia mydas TaxID=8469 RepID=UPI001CA88939|nr:sex comb on midleg-like protein 4 isoform X2 [Chelonia mydas]XP_043398688.1 sex comb on midleg-like protein 4 isoform X2 [Chelonia mydas]XP_043398689.1 sex comb on midleg-like protein 4 isoform X2 [Chelonia mydas]
MSHLSSLPPRLDTVDMQSPRIPGRKRGRPPLHSTPMKMAVHNLYSAPSGSLPVVKIPKKRGRKPGYKLKSRVLMTPLAISPPRSTPEPDISSIPQDAATIPNSAAPQALTVCIYVNKQANMGPYLDRKKVQQLPDHFGPERPSMVLQQAVQACIDCAHQQKTVFSLVKQGYGGEMVSVSASFDGKQHLLSLPVVNSIGYVLRFLKKLCRSLLCDNLFSNQPFPQYSSTSGNPAQYENGRLESASSPSPERQDAARPSSKNPSTWTVDDVVWFVKDADPHALGPHVELFRKHEIDGNALLLLKSDMIMKYLGLKLGPALKLCYHIDKLKQAKF